MGGTVAKRARGRGRRTRGRGRRGGITRMATQGRYQVKEQEKNDSSTLQPAELFRSSASRSRSQQPASEEEKIREHLKNDPTKSKAALKNNSVNNVENNLNESRFVKKDPTRNR